MKKGKHYTVFIFEAGKIHAFMLDPKIPRGLNLEISSFILSGDCIRELTKRPDIIVLDYKLVGNNMSEISKAIKTLSPKSSVIILIEPEDQSALKYLPTNAHYDFLVKDKDSSKLTDILMQRIINAIERAENRNRIVRQKLAALYIITAILLTALTMYYFR